MLRTLMLVGLLLVTTSCGTKYTPQTVEVTDPGPPQRVLPTITVIDSAQLKERTTVFDFDMLWYQWGLSLSPGNEQYGYWGMEAADTEEDLLYRTGSYRVPSKAPPREQLERPY